MDIFATIDEYRAWRRSVPPGISVGFVPTMGALHAGHRRLIEKAVGDNDRTVVSIFVNPLQFGPNEDFGKYPRTFEDDLRMCREAGAAAVFAPSREAFYAPDHATFVEVEGLDRFLCGAARPGHFRGVCTVVLKLFHVVQPAVAYFGQKDIQQALILERMISDLSLDLRMEIVETVREPSGLAMSSRNRYMSEDERQRASALHRAMRKAEAALAAGERSAKALKAIMQEEVSASGPGRIDYIEVVDRRSLSPIERVEAAAVLALAVFYGQARLIDNLLVNPPSD